MAKKSRLGIIHSDVWTAAYGASYAIQVERFRFMSSEALDSEDVRASIAERARTVADHAVEDVRSRR